MHLYYCLRTIRWVWHLSCMPCLIQFWQIHGINFLLGSKMVTLHHLKRHMGRCFGIMLALIRNLITCSMMPWQVMLDLSLVWWLRNVRECSWDWSHWLMLGEAQGPWQKPLLNHSLGWNALCLIYHMLFLAWKEVRTLNMLQGTCLKQFLQLMPFC